MITDIRSVNIRLLSKGAVLGGKLFQLCVAGGVVAVAFYCSCKPLVVLATIINCTVTLR